MKSKKRIKTETINKVAIAVSVIAVVACIALSAVLIYVVQQKEQMTMVELISRSNDAINEYQYGHVGILRNDNLADGTEYQSQYDLASQRDGEYASFMFRDSEGVSLYQCWIPAEDHYDIWVYDGDYDVWVATGNSEPPAYSSMWNPMVSTSQYTLLDGTYPWYDTGEECYVLQLISSTDEWSTIYEEMFISATTFLPVGVVDILSNTTDVVNHDYVQENVDLGDGVSGDVQVETHAYDEVIQKYTLSYSNSDLRLFDIPDVTVTEDEYLNIIGSGVENNEQVQ